MPARAFAHDLLTNRVCTFHEMCHCHIIARLQPSVAIAVEKHFARDVRRVSSCGVPQPPVEEDCISRLREDRCRALGVCRFFCRHFYRVPLLTARYYGEVAASRHGGICQEIGDFQRDARARVAFQFDVQAAAILMPAETFRCVACFWWQRRHEDHVRVVKFDVPP